MRLVLLDRDGVINVDRDDSVKSVEEFVLLPKVISAIKLFNEKNIPVAVVTNQAVVGRGILSRMGLQEIHDHLEQLLKNDGVRVDKIYACTSSDDTHPDRKPNPGLVNQALKDFQVDSTEAVFIGDALRDLQAAYKAGCDRILVRTGKGEATLESGLPEELLPVEIFDDLYDASCYIVERAKC